MKKSKKINLPKPDEEELPLVPGGTTPPESEEENPGSGDSVQGTGNPPPTKPTPIKK